LNRRLTRITDTFIAVAQAHGEFLRSFEKFPADKVRVIRNGIDCERFRPSVAARDQIRQELGLAKDTLLVGIVAALRSEKNHGLFVRMAADVRNRHPDAHWVIVGDGPQRKSIEFLVNELRMQDRIHFLGTRHDIPQIVASLDLFTLCSLNEASPVSVLESLACEIPVVATDVGSLRESIIHGETGLLVPPSDLRFLSAAVEQLLSSQRLRQSMGTAGREHVRRSASLQAMVDGYQQMMIELYDARAEATKSLDARPERNSSRGNLATPTLVTGDRR
jgi:glycosyltransferase involved in cell wall biosynthesis